MRQNGLWQAVLGEIELSVSRGNFVTWFKNTRLIHQDDDVAVIGVPNVFIKQQLERKYCDLITETLKKNGVSAKQVEFKISSLASTHKVREDESLLTTEAPVTTQAERPTNRTSQESRSYYQGLNERYTFESFVVGASNELAFAACQAIAGSPGTRYNPLFLYGGVGIGKTHLIQAVGNAIISKNPDARVLYISTEQFVREFVDALRFRKTGDFASNYRSADVLIVDDVQFIAGKEKMQEEFFHTFNTLHQANKQIIMSSDKPPKEIPTLEERLRSRFAWGMSIDMQVPDFETRCAILHLKANAQSIELSPEVVEYLATNNQTNIRELEGALNQLLAFCEVRGFTPDLAIATGLFGNMKARPKHISAKQIVERTAKHFQVSIEDIMGPKRDKDIVVPRQVAMYILRSELHLSFPKIARELGRKDHTTAIHSVEKIERDSNLDAELRAALNDIKERLYV